mgnify:CR=1 FL=1
MNTATLIGAQKKCGAFLCLLACTAVSAASIFTASLVQRDCGRVEVRDVWFANQGGIPVRAKLFVPAGASGAQRVPGMVYIHGYQNNRETGDAYSIETARRGIAVLNIDAIGRGHSGIPGRPDEPGFDPTYGGTAAVAYLRSLEFVDGARVGIMGHSLGAEMAYKVALNDPSLRALVLTGYAYTTQATPEMPRNMLMIIGKYDEFRARMTGTRDIEREWMGSAATAKALGAADAKLATTYGDFAKGTARRVEVPPVTHVQESHSSEAIAQTLLWLRAALAPAGDRWIDERSQTWMIKEYATLFAMLAGFAALFPLALMLMRTRFFGALRRDHERYACAARDYVKFTAVNGALMWLYLPLILVLFGVHKYLVPIDRAFPMMMVNAIVWWLLWVNVIGLLLFRRWFRKNASPRGVTLADLGVSFAEKGLSLDRGALGRAALLAIVLFAFMYLVELAAEKCALVNYRFVYPFMNDLTAYRAGMFALYFPFVLFCLVVTGIFLHGQLRRPAERGWLGTLAARSGYSVLALCLPLVLFLMMQYVPLFVNGFIPFTGPNGLFVVFVINMFPMIALFALTAVLSVWMHQLTGTVYAGAGLNALIITWVLASSQVIAPIPV